MTGYTDGEEQDLVFEQSDTTYDGAGNVLQTAQLQRYHDDTTSAGPLVAGESARPQYAAMLYGREQSIATGRSMTALELIKTWRAHTADVYRRRGRADVYELEVMHTCHGCGAAAGIVIDGLCETCQEAYELAVSEPVASSGRQPSFEEFLRLSEMYAAEMPSSVSSCNPDCDHRGGCWVARLRDLTALEASKRSSQYGEIGDASI